MNSSVVAEVNAAMETIKNNRIALRSSSNGSFEEKEKERKLSGEIQTLYSVMFELNGGLKKYLIEYYPLFWACERHDNKLAKIILYSTELSKSDIRYIESLDIPIYEIRSIMGKLDPSIKNNYCLKTAIKQKNKELIEILSKDERVIAMM